MNNKKIGKIMNMLLGLASLLILIGTIFRLQHWQYSHEILRFGIISGIILSSYEIARLKKIIKQMEKDLHG